jgi:hypothetical protein
LTITKPIEALTEGDFQALVRESVAESETLDYKLQMYGMTDNDKREMLHDVSSMANNLTDITSGRSSTSTK